MVGVDIREFRGFPRRMGKAAWGHPKGWTPNPAGSGRSFLARLVAGFKVCQVCLARVYRGFCILDSCTTRVRPVYDLCTEKAKGGPAIMLLETEGYARVYRLWCRAWFWRRKWGRKSEIRNPKQIPIGPNGEMESETMRSRCRLGRCNTPPPPVARASAFRRTNCSTDCLK
jgi:hypothetical protein